jgi:Family of unknown function (DUF6152)
VITHGSFERWQPETVSPDPLGRCGVKVKRWTSLAAAAGLILISAPIRAHHGTADYDMTKLVTLKGTVTDFQFINPHTTIYFDVKDDKGNVEKWAAEAGSATGMSRIGWNKNTLKPGDSFTAVGNRAKNGSKTLHLRKVVLSNGQEFHVERVEDYADY